MQRAGLLVVEMNKTIITPTKRLRRYLQLEYAKEQIAQGNVVWPSLDCLPWNAWCQRLFSDISLNIDEHFQLLRPHQQRWLWQDIIQHSRYREQLLQVQATARHVQAAYEQCRAWQIPVFPENVFLSEDAQAFKHWYQTYVQRKKEHCWIDDAELPDFIEENILVNTITNTLVFQGFDYFTTQQQHLIQTLKDHGVDVDIQMSEQRNKSVSVFAANDKQQEIINATNWAKQKIKSDPDATIGILTPRLGLQRNVINRLMVQTLEPAQLIYPHAKTGNLFSISLGKPLSDYSMIQIALVILDLGHRSISIHDLSRLLHTHYIQAVEDELAKRARFDLLLRKKGYERISLKSIYRIAENGKEQGTYCERFIQQLKDFELRFLSYAKQETYRQWAEYFSQLLNCFTWPTEKSLNSDEYQTLSKWQDVLKDLSNISLSDKKVSYFTALSQLKHLLNEQRFQPETEETPIQVSELDGVAAMQFDALWIMDMQDDVWPEAKTANPFIPIVCQREYNVPEADANSRLQMAKDMTIRLYQSAKDVVFSYSHWEGDRECRPTALIQTFIEQNNIPTIEVTDSVKQQIFLSAKQELFYDSPPEFKTDKEKAAGGSGLFRDQSLCPFRAFARHRLFAESLPQSDIGLSASERGKLVHRVMQYLWQRIGKQKKLLYLSSNEIDKLVHSVVLESIKQHAEHNPELFPQRFSELEQKRLEGLVKQWLEIEKQRAPFNVIKTEEWQTIHFAGLELNICIDRIDEIAEGQYAIIDYKTGKVSKSDWESDNPNEPQLPLYAVTTNEDVIAVAFASLKSGELGYKGQANADELFPKIKANKDYSWQQCLEDWQTALNRLAEDFKRGYAAVEPKDRRACEYCDLHGLCRFYERVTNHLEDDEVDVMNDE